MCIPGVLHLHYIYEDYLFFLCDLVYNVFVSYQDVSSHRLPMTYGIHSYPVLARVRHWPTSSSPQSKDGLDLETAE